MSDNSRDYGWFNTFCDSYELGKYARDNRKKLGNSAKELFSLSKDSSRFPKENQLIQKKNQIEQDIARRFNQLSHENWRIYCEKAAEKAWMAQQGKFVEKCTDQAWLIDFSAAVSMYYLLKQQRNYSNHAGGEGKKLWSLSQTKQYILEYVELLRKFIA